MSTAISRKTTSGLRISVGIYEARDAPPIEPRKAGSAIVISNLESVLIFRRYISAEADVPKIDGTLFVPRITTVSDFANPIIKAGS
jgi:hypothetical protein